MKRFSTILFCLLLAVPAFAQWTRDPNLPRRVKLYNANDSLFVPLINGQAIRQGASLSDTTKFQTTIANLADTSKYFKTYDSAGTSGWYRRGYVDALLAAKQATIANLADTSKYFKTYDSAGTSGWYRRGYVDALLAAKQATIANLADTAKYIEVSDTTTLFAAKLGGWVEIIRSADTTNSGVVTYGSLGELHFSMAASGCYEIDAHLFFTKASDAKAYSVALNCTGTPTNIGLVASGLGGATDGTDLTAQSIINSAADSLQLTVATVGNNKLEEVLVRGMIINEAAANLFGFKWHAETNGAVTLKRGSYLRYRRMY